MVMEVMEDLMEVMVVMDTAEVMAMERERLMLILSQDMVMEDLMEVMVVMDTVEDMVVMVMESKSD